MKCKTLLIVPPCGPSATSYPPYGALYIGTYLQNKGYEVKVLNIDLERLNNSETIKRIKEYGPDIIGFSAIVSNSYKYIKDLSFEIKKNFPKIFMLMGGQLSYAAKVVLTHTPVDLVVIGEGENTIIELYEYLSGDPSFKDAIGVAYKEVEGEWVKKSQTVSWLGKINGIAYKEKNGEIIYTEMVKQIPNLDDLSVTNYNLIDMKSYLLTGKQRFGDFHIKDPRFYEPHRQDKKAFTIMTGRGCQAKCSFCTRGVRGLRKHSPEYILDMMEHLIKEYNVGFFTFGDESFVSSKRWVLNFLEKLKARKFDILFYILGARVDIIDRELIFALKDAGCFMVEYGYESGSQRMLDTIEKRTTVTENYRTHRLTVKEAGMNTVPAFVINLPGETSETISETIQFIKSLELDEPMFLVKYAQAQPGSPLYEYGLLSGMIKDEDQYLYNIYETHPGDLDVAFKNNVLHNFSKQPLDEVFSWQEWMLSEIKQDCEKRNKKKAVIFNESTSLSGKPGEYAKKAEGMIKIFLKKFIRKVRKDIKIFGKKITIFYFLPVQYKSSLIKKLSKKYLNGSSRDKELYNLIRISNELSVKKLGKPIKRDANGNAVNVKKIEDSKINPDIKLYEEQVEDFNIKRYESLKVICEDYRKSGKSTKAFAIDVASLPTSTSGM